MAHRAQHASLSDAGLAVQEHLGVLLYGLADLVDDILFRRRQPQILVAGLLRKRRFGQLEEAQVRLGHCVPPSELGSSFFGARRSVFVGSKPV